MLNLWLHRVHSSIRTYEVISQCKILIKLNESNEFRASMSKFRLHPHSNKGLMLENGGKVPLLEHACSSFKVKMFSCNRGTFRF